MTDLYRKSPEAEALLKGIPPHLFRSALLCFALVLASVVVLGMTISFPIESNWDGYVRIIDRGNGAFELLVDRQDGMAQYVAHEITLRLREDEGKELLLEGIVGEVSDRGITVLATAHQADWASQKESRFASISVRQGKLPLWKKLLGGWFMT
ncbi:MAG: hypothetical protein NWR72_05225 [Bacteroidia bacterium]|nr:hypothetical protein [Bacteroidia bacterium]